MSEVEKLKASWREEPKAHDGLEVVSVTSFPDKLGKQVTIIYDEGSKTLALRQGGLTVYLRCPSLTCADRMVNSLTSPEESRICDEEAITYWEKDLPHQLSRCRALLERYLGEGERRYGSTGAILHAIKMAEWAQEAQSRDALWEAYKKLKTN